MSLFAADLHRGSDDLSEVRAYTEYCTNSSMFHTVDYAAYAKISAWCAYSDKLATIQSVLADRLPLPAPSSYKALIIAQALPSSSLLAILEPLEKLATRLSALEGDEEKDKDKEPHPYMHTIASHLVDLANAAKQYNDEKEKQEKWDCFTRLYGKTDRAWIPLPDPPEPEWGWYGVYWVGPEVWWAVPED